MKLDVGKMLEFKADSLKIILEESLVQKGDLLRRGDGTHW